MQQVEGQRKYEQRDGWRCRPARKAQDHFRLDENGDGGDAPKEGSERQSDRRESIVEAEVDRFQVEGTLQKGRVLRGELIPLLVIEEVPADISAAQRRHRR